MCLGTFSRRARSLATCFCFARVRIIGTLVPFCVIRNFKEFPITRKRQFPAFAREPPPISLTAIFKIVPTAFCKTNTDFLQIYLQISDPNPGFVRFPLIQFRPVFITSPRKIIPHRSPRCQFPRFQTFPPIHLPRSDLKMPEASVQDGYS